MTTKDSGQDAATDGCLAPDSIEMLVVHCSDTPDDQHLGARDIQTMHLGFGWDGIGYHQVIRRDGTRESGRPAYWKGAHVKGVNDRSLGVCLIGRNSFTPAQMHSLAGLLFEWLSLHPSARVLGHRDAVETHKTCPNFDAAAWWQDYLAGGPGDVMHVGSSVLPVTAEPGTGLPLETEVLFGEEVAVLERKAGFARVRLRTDGYVGWVPIDKPPSPITPPTHRIIAPSVFALAAPKVTSPMKMRLGMGALVTVGETVEEWHAIDLPDGGTGWIAGHTAAPLDQFADDFVAVAEQFLGAPYLWGGRSAAGLDCSALLQLALQATGVSAPRNSGDQLAWAEATGSENTNGLPGARRGDLVFWPGHVGICQSATSLLHANAHHHAVALEPLEDALARIDKATGQRARFLRLADQPAQAVSPLSGTAVPAGSTARQVTGSPSPR